MSVKIITIFLLLTFPAYATQYYVSTTGNDSNDGLSIADAHAWLTIQHAADTAVAGDTVDVLAGTYDGALFSAHDGALGSPITFETYQSGTVIVNPRTAARDPIFIPVGTTWTDLGLNTAGNAHKWASPNNTITNTNNGIGGLLRNHQYWFARTQFPSNYFGHGIDPWYFYDSANKRVLLNQPTDPGLDEWVIVDNSMQSILIHTSYMVFTGFTTQYSNDGFRSSSLGTPIGGYYTSHNVYNNITTKYNGRRGMTLECEATNPITDQHVNNLITFTNGEHGFKQEDNTSQENDPYVCTNFVINHVTSYGNGYHGIQISNGGDKISVSNSVSYDNGLNPCGTNATSGEGCASFASNYSNGLADDITWTSNEGYSTGTIPYWGTDNAALVRPGMSSFSDKRLTMQKNYLHDNHGPGFFTTRNIGKGSGNIFRNNIVINNSNFDMDFTLNAAFEIYNNVIGDGSLGEITLCSSCSGYIIKNNAIFSLTGVPILSITTGATPTLDYNAWYSPDATPFSYNGTSYNFADYKTNSSQDAHSIAMDFRSEFTNFAGKDFSITYSGAPDLRDAGINLIPDSPDDYTGRLRPQNVSTAIGAYEEPVHNPSVTLSGGVFNVSVN